MSWLESLSKEEKSAGEPVRLLPAEADEAERYEGRPTRGGGAEAGVDDQVRSFRSSILRRSKEVVR